MARASLAHRSRTISADRTSTRPEDPRCPSDLTAGLGSAALFAAVALLTIPSRKLPLGADLVVLTAIVAVSAWLGTPAGALAATGVGWLLLDGFLVDQQGALRWHGPPDLVRLLVLVGVAISVSSVRAAMVQLPPLERRHRIAERPRAEPAPRSTGWYAAPLLRHPRESPRA